MSELIDSDKPDVEEILMTLLHQTIRNYDVMIHLLKHFDEEAAGMLVSKHENMEVWGPPPFYT